MDNLCNSDYSKISSQETIKILPFKLYELNSVNKIDIKITGFVDSASGYARITRDVIQYLQESGQFNIKLEKLKSPIDIDPFECQKFNYLTRTKISDKFIELVIAAPAFLERLKDSNAIYKIGYTMGEAEQIPDCFLKMCPYCDELFLPTDLDIDRFDYEDRRYKITKMSLWVDLEHYKTDVHKINIANIPKNNFIFMFVGTWNKRKGIEEIISAFIEEFTNEDPVTLVLMAKYTVKPFDDERRSRKENEIEKWNILWEYDYLVNSKYKDREDKPHIVLLDVPLNESIMPNFMKNANVCIAASSGESTWLPGLEFGAMGISSIQNIWGGHADYLGNDNSFLVKSDFDNCDKELYEGVSEYYKDVQMAFVDIEDLRKNMRIAYKQRNRLGGKGGRIQHTVRRVYDKEIRLKALKQRLVVIWESLK